MTALNHEERRAAHGLILEIELIARVHHDSADAPRQRGAAARARELFGLPANEDDRLFSVPAEDAKT